MCIEDLRVSYGWLMRISRPSLAHQVGQLRQDRDSEKVELPKYVVSGLCEKGVRWFRGATVDKLALMLMVDAFLEMEVPLAQGGLMIESWLNGIKIVGARKPGVKLIYAIKERAEHAC
jgi:hypothetical protein